MGCSTSKLDDEEAVQLCRDRRKFIKQAVEQRYRFALGLVNYIQSQRRVSIALLNFVQGNEHLQFLQSHCTTPPFTPVKIIGIPDQRSTNHVINYLRSSGNVSVPVEEWPVSPEIARMESYYSSNHDGIDGPFTYEASQTNLTSSSSTYNRPSYSPPSQNSQWEFFWNPFSSLDQYGYQLGSSADDELEKSSTVRVEEGIPALEETQVKEGKEEEGIEEEEVEDKGDEISGNCGENKDKSKTDSEPNAVLVNGPEEKYERGREKVNGLKECQSQGVDSIQVAEARDAVEVEASARHSVEETPGFTVYVNRRPASMVEVMKDLESQFVNISDAAHEVAVMLEASRAQYSVNAGARMLNPAALFRSPSSLSSSSRFFQTHTSSRDDRDESTSIHSEEQFSATCGGSHQSTLDRLYAWEKKLYEEVKCGEGIRIAYEKKCMLLRRHDVNGEEPCVVDKTRASIRDLQTQLKVSVHSVESVSQRIETLRDEELYPQLLMLIQGLSNMWRRIADCHRIQKDTIEEAKLLLFSSASSSTPIIPPKASRASTHPPWKQYTSTSHLLMLELKKWKNNFATCVDSQRLYAGALTGWTSRCAPTSMMAMIDEQSPRNSSTVLTPPPVCGLCEGWLRLLDSVSEGHVIEGMDFFSAGIGSVTTGLVGEREDRGEGGVVMVAGGGGMKEVGERVICAGMAAVAGSLTDFADCLARGYEALLNKYCLH